MSEAVVHPDHYGGGDNPYEAIKVIREWTRDLPGDAGFNIGNALKYISRAGRKDPDKLVEDLQKAVWYLEDQIVEEVRKIEESLEDDLPF